MTVRCPFSTIEPVNATTGYENIQYSFDAPRAGGKYCTRQGFGHLVEEIRRLGDQGKARVVTLLVDRRRSGVEEPELTIDLIRRAEVKPDLSQEERARRLLEFLIVESNSGLGMPIDISRDKIEPILAWIESKTNPDLLWAWRIESKTKGEPCILQEIRFLCDHLEKQGLIAYEGRGNSVCVTVDGYSEMDPRKKQSAAEPQSGTSAAPQARGSRRVFVVHGRDDGTKETVARYLEKLDLQPVILHEQASEGKTIIEKFEAHAEVAYAVVLFTPDDEGYPAGMPDRAQPRARQNAVLELGFFTAKLGRERVCLLHKGKMEMPSDYAGVLYVELDDPGAWRLAVAKEIRACGIEIDLNKVM